jgi:hypothetical protein
MRSHSLRSTALLAPVISCATCFVGAARPVSAQDSVSIAGCLPGDALVPWDDAAAPTGSAQKKTYVVDLAPLSSSWGTSFGIAPVVKSSRTSSAFFTSLVSAQACSRVQALGVPFAGASYAAWQTPGEGVNGDATLNVPAGAIAPPALGHQLGLAFAEFATADGGASYNAVIGARVGIDPTDAGRLWVERTVAATNGCDGQTELSQFGLGAIDERGQLALRADDFLTNPGGCGLTPIQQDNVFRVDLAARNAAVKNVVSHDLLLGGGQFDVGATDQLVFNYSLATVVTPNVVPGALTGGDALYVGTDFTSQFLRGTSFATLVADQSHLAPGSVATRGNLSLSTRNFAFLASTHGTAAVLATDAAGKVKILNVFGLDALGNPTAKTGFVLPAVVTDNATGYVNTGADNSFAHHYSQTPFRGGNGQIAVGRDQAGRLLLAAVVDQPTGGVATNNKHYVAVARVDAATGAASWTMASYNDDLVGKELLNGAGGAAIGRVTKLQNIPGAPVGPSLSAPMIDGAGNVWFLSALEIYDGSGMPGAGSTFTTGLVRAVYDPASFSYQLELVLKSGDAFAGQNSGRNYSIGFIQIADSNSIGSGTAFSQNVSEVGHLSQDVGGLAPADPRSLGGLVISAEIIYDFDADGDYVECSVDPLSLDQDYNVLLYLGSTASAADLDLNGIADPAQGLFGDKTALSLSAGGTLAFALQAGVGEAGKLYLMLGSASGTLPGLPIDGLVLPLNFDAYFLYTLTTPNAPPLAGSAGFLNGLGKGAAAFTIPAGTSPSLAGAVIHHAFAAVKLIGIPQVTFTSNAWPLLLVP